MSEDAFFVDLIARVRAGDPQAAVELVRDYEPAIRLVVRRRLTDPGLRRLLDSTDICQSVLGSFFVRAALGQYNLSTPEELLKLLATMARNKLADQVLKQRAARRDVRRLQADGSAVIEVVDPRASPSQVVADREFLREVRHRLSEDERQLVEQRALGRSWTEIAAVLGGSPDGLRMRLSRAIDRVAREMGLERELV
jgi:RNA polymerase sigma factor (sigma-70 family)